MSRTRLAIGTAGALLGLFGVFRLITQIPVSDLIMLAIWLVGAVLIHDGILSPLIIGIGALLHRFVRPRARRYLQAALTAGGLVTVIAIPLIYRRNSQAKSKAILQQNYFGNLTVLLGIIGALALLGYAVHVGRDQSRRVRPVESETKLPNP